MDNREQEHEHLNNRITSCFRCPRLVEWRELVALEKRKAFTDWQYWGRPVPNFGDPNAQHLIVGLAPAAHGANRTGQMFTGDRSGDWLFRALHKVGAANMPRAEIKADGLKLHNVLITAAAHCAPPDNKPLPLELANCNEYLRTTLALNPWKSVLCLGSIAWSSVFRTLGTKVQKFGHGQVHITESGLKLVGSYHPSQQNTFTGRLTEEMLDQAISHFLS